MSIEVYILRQGDDRHHKLWAENPHHEGGDYKFDEPKWRDLIYSQVAPLQGKYRLPAEDFHSPAEVFLCMREDHLVGRYNRRLLGGLFSLAVRHSWGGPNYLAVDDRIGARLWSQPDLNLHGLRECLRLALESGVADLIEARFDRRGGDPIYGKLLRHGADKSVGRLTQARKIIADTAWRCYVPGVGSTLHRLLENYILSKAELRLAEKFIIVFDKTTPADQLLFLKQARREYRHARRVVALCGQVSLRSEQAASDVYKYCRDEWLLVMEFGGVFELIYSMLRLEKESVKTIYSMSDFHPEKGKVEPVEPLGSQTFNRDRASGTPKVLLTNCFDLEDDCIEASHDAGEIRRIIPVIADYRVCPSLESRRLPDLLRGLLGGAIASANKSSLAVWLYLGHGYKNKGLQSGRGNEIENADGWLKRFAGYQGALPLVFLASCRSDVVARKFAEAGAGVAIGFAGDVLPKACRLLAQPVILALLRAWEDRAALLPNVILDAYEKGCRDLIANDLDQAKPVAFYQKTEVRICR